MGPYCNYCNQRCFVHIPQFTPEHLLKKLKNCEIVATCSGGKKFEKEKLGVCYDDLRLASLEEENKALKHELKKVAILIHEMYDFDKDGDLKVKTRDLITERLNGARYFLQKFQIYI